MQIGQTIHHSLAIAKIAAKDRKETLLPRWTLKRLVHWVETQFNLKICRDTIRKTMKKQGFSWKKARKLLNKADSQKRAHFLGQLEKLLKQTIKNDHLLVYIDEAHIHLDCDEGYGWSVKGERFWISSSSLGKEKVSFYGASHHRANECYKNSLGSRHQYTTIT